MSNIIRLKEIYSDLYQQGQQVLKDNNPCKVKDGKCMAGNFCCHGCKHLGPTGCTVEALSCKLWLCYEAQCTPDGIRAAGQLNVLKKIAYERRVAMPIRTSKEEAFQHYDSLYRK